MARVLYRSLEQRCVQNEGPPLKEHSFLISGCDSELLWAKISKGPFVASCGASRFGFETASESLSMLLRSVSSLLSICMSRETVVVRPLDKPSIQRLSSSHKHNFIWLECQARLQVSGRQSRELADLGRKGKERMHFGMRNAMSEMNW